MSLFHSFKFRDISITSFERISSLDTTVIQPFIISVVLVAEQFKDSASIISSILKESVPQDCSDPFACDMVINNSERIRLLIKQYGRFE